MRGVKVDGLGGHQNELLLGDRSYRWRYETLTLRTVRKSVLLLGTKKVVNVQLRAKRKGFGLLVQEGGSRWPVMKHAGEIS